MEHTTFEVEEAARLMNANFVNVKVDREERPDVDKVYMNYVLLTTGHGGWPMSVFLAPETLAPIFGGTYFSAHGEGRRPGFINICEAVALQWKTNRDKILQSSGTIARHLQSKVTEAPQGDLKGAFLETLEQYLEIGAKKRAKSFDETYGGWGDQPKFPQPVIMTALLNAHYLNKINESDSSSVNYLEQVQKTLRAMYAGGIHDHLGGGFHRYSVTDDWKLPHFEKMLYDQSQLANAYLATYQLTLLETDSSDDSPTESNAKAAEVFKLAAQDIFRYVLAQLCDRSTGAFYSAEDADSPLKEDPNTKREGAFYVWTSNELKALLSDGELAVVTSFYNVQKSGNVAPEYDPHNELTSQNILHATEDALNDASLAIGNEEKDVLALLESAHNKLRAAQSTRPRPHLDDKCVTVWNAMMIGAFAKGYQVLQDQSLLDSALRALSFIKSTLYNPETKRLIRSYREGPSNIEGFADDYAATIAALLDVYEATFDTSHLEWAIELQDTMDELFWDSTDGAYFQDSGNPALHLLVRTKEEHDGSEPSYNSVAAVSLVKLYHILGNPKYQQRAQNLLASFATHLAKIPVTLPLMTVAASALSRPSKSVLIYGKLDSPQTKTLIKTVQTTYDPFRVVLQASHGSESSQFFQKQGLETFTSLESSAADDNKVSVFVCKDFTCGLPVSDVEELKKLL